MTVQISLPNWLICAPNAARAPTVAHRHSGSSPRSEAGQAGDWLQSRHWSGTNRCNAQNIDGLLYSDWGGFDLCSVIISINRASVIKASWHDSEAMIDLKCLVLSERPSGEMGKMETLRAFWRNIPVSAEALVLIRSVCLTVREMVWEFPHGLHRKDLYLFLCFTLLSHSEIILRLHNTTFNKEVLSDLWFFLPFRFKLNALTLMNYQKNQTTKIGKSAKKGKPVSTKESTRGA